MKILVDADELVRLRDLAGGIKFDHEKFKGADARADELRNNIIGGLDTLINEGKIDADVYDVARWKPVIGPGFVGALSDICMASAVEHGSPPKIDFEWLRLNDDDADDADSRFRVVISADMQAVGSEPPTFEPALMILTVKDGSEVCFIRTDKKIRLC